MLTGFVRHCAELVSNGRPNAGSEAWLGKRDGDGGERATALAPPQEGRLPLWKTQKRGHFFNLTVKTKRNTLLSLTNLLQWHLGSSRCQMHRFWRKGGTIDELFQRLEEEK